uniref:Peptidase A2 domain-containing protein n=1 Tax=Panagrolaimus sp. ES5 TaxID=591445 RepID=A0AC34G4W9_9BILA
MTVNTSGSIRQALGRARKAGENQIDSIKKLLDDSPRPWNDIIAADIAAVTCVMEKTLQKLEELWGKWEKFIDHITNDENHAAEESLYNEWRDKQEYITITETLEMYVFKVKALLTSNATNGDRSSTASTQKDNQEPKKADESHPTEEKPADGSNCATGDKDAMLVSDVKPSTQKFITTPVPQLNMPKYTGDYLKWNAFWQIFDITIHQQNYPNVSKLIALRSLLDGRALEEIESFTISDQNYETVNQIIGKMPVTERNELELMLFTDPLTSTDRVLEKMKVMEIKAELFSSSVSRPSSNPTARPMEKPIGNGSTPWKSLYQTQQCAFCDAMICLNKNQSTLLTKKVNVTNIDRGTTAEATLFFDSGAQRSYIADNLVKTLNLPAVNKECLNVQGFGGKTSVYKSDLVKLRIQTIGGYKDIFANSIKKIADHLPVIQKETGASYSESKERPDILIGMDYFCEFVTSSKEIEPGFYTVNSIVGEMYAGKVPNIG